MTLCAVHLHNFSFRIRAVNYTLSRPMLSLGRYTMLKVGHKSAEHDPERFVNAFKRAMDTFPVHFRCTVISTPKRTSIFHSCKNSISKL